MASLSRCLCVQKANEKKRINWKRWRRKEKEETREQKEDQKTEKETRKKKRQNRSKEKKKSNLGIDPLTGPMLIDQGPIQAQAHFKPQIAKDTTADPNPKPN
jgi:hypothetical protein